MSTSAAGFEREQTTGRDRHLDDIEAGPLAGVGCNRTRTLFLQLADAENGPPLSFNGGRRVQAAAAEEIGQVIG